MLPQKRMIVPCLAMLALVGAPRPSLGGTITFTGDAALVSALGGPLSTGVNEVAVGQTVNLPFSATVTGVESVSGTVVLSADANGGSIQLNNVVFTVLSATTSTASFGLSATQAFAYSGPNTLNALETGDASAHFTQPGAQILPGSADVTAGVTFQPTIKPDSGSTSFGIVPFNFNVFAFPDDTFPEDQNFTSLSRPITGIPRTTSNPVTLTFSYSTTISPFNTTTGAGTSTTLRTGAFAFNGVSPAAVPEPSSLAMLCVGMAGIVTFARRHRAA
jgi:PEP-CTERM motif